MIEITMPLWLAIGQYVIVGLIIIHLLFGDLLAKLTYRYLKDKEKDEDNNNEQH